jgi:adenosine/AMP kinase
VAFNEASGDRLVRFDGNDAALTREAVEISGMIGAGHTFVIVLREGYPINVLNRIKSVEEVVNIFAATSNPLSVVVYDNGSARGILGVLDGKPPLGIEKDNDKENRHNLLKKIGYKR